MMDKRILKIMAEAERMMDAGKVKWVLAISPISDKYERFPVPDQIMTDLGLEQGQKINSIIADAIAEISLKNLVNLAENISKDLEKKKEEDIDSKLEEGFDFRDMMDKK